MISVDSAITRFRRDLTIAALLRGALMASAVFFVLFGPMLGLHGDGLFVIGGIGAVWVMLTYRSMRGSRLAADSPMLIATGQFEQAEQKIDGALKSFSMFRTVKLVSIYHLALLRHAQKRWRESALLTQALLSQKLGQMQGISRTSRLLMADSFLQMGDLRGAFDAMTGLYNQRLSLSESLTLQLLQLDYGARIGAWDQMLAGIGTKVQLSELMPAANAARSQALLALAAEKINRKDLSAWLRKRAELLADKEDIISDRPVLTQLFDA